MIDPVVVCLSRSGEATAWQVAEILGASVHGRMERVERAHAYFENGLEHVRMLFASGTPIVGVCATGILVRAVAPLLNDKRLEPPVVAVPDDGSVVIPLLGGHRGANRLAQRIARGLNESRDKSPDRKPGQSPDGVPAEGFDVRAADITTDITTDITAVTAAITTAGDVALGIALDEPPAGYRLANADHAKGAMAALLGGAGVTVSGENIFDVEDTGGGVELAVTDAPSEGSQMRLVYHPQRFALGLGCARGCKFEEMWKLVETTLAEHGIAQGAVACVGSLDLKGDEPAMIEAAKRLQVPLRLFTAAALEAEAPRLANPSDVVFAAVGCHGVSEGAALALGDAKATLLVAKQKTANATCAVVRSDAPIVAMNGRSRGKLSIIGIGPGQHSWRTPEASGLIAEADELVGYGLYIDLLGALAHGKLRSDFVLGEEEDRCRHALEQAGQGRKVALICSGDAGIYAMGALVFELLDRAPENKGVTDAARRVEVVSAPGISALQGAAARAGAPLGHDFCAISLSDLLTPREDIVKRLKAAAEGDFVIAFYNPVSRRRRTLLAEARDILLRHRPDDTPVLLASSVGRADENLRYCTLCELNVEDVDMLTVVLVGSSNSRLAQLGEGLRMYTPRGYARKIDGELAKFGEEKT